MSENFPSLLPDVFPAGAGVIPNFFLPPLLVLGVSRRRGGDPEREMPFPETLECFPQARG